MEAQHHHQCAIVFSNHCIRTFVNIDWYIMCSASVTYTRYLPMHYLSYSLLFPMILAIFLHGLVSCECRHLFSATGGGWGVFMWCCFLVFFYCLRNQCRWITISSILCCGELKYKYWKSGTCKSLIKKCLLFCCCCLFYEQVKREILSKVNLCPVLSSTNSFNLVLFIHS